MDGSNVTEQMKRQPRTRVHQRSELPVEKALNRLAKGTDERGKGSSENQEFPFRYN